MCSQISTKNNIVEIDNGSRLDTPTPKALNVPSAVKPAKEPESSPALDEMVEALHAEVERTMTKMKAVWEEIAIEDGQLYTIPEWI
ncbi:hypothetical protein FLONG3_7086 [Fusarium longipes]|uniref:Uncharacterized protein n=1 Tax=Fusarium longipes TaxID=694270 RepID=A0A395SGJ5_9HYPO|nr:hypothetical protein FLONG3_7086 [Fusarium longipes]